MKPQKLPSSLHNQNFLTRTVRTITQAIVIAVVSFVGWNSKYPTLQWQISHAHEGHEPTPGTQRLVFKQGSLHIYARFEALPIVGQESILQLDVMDSKNHRLTEISDDIDVVLWMPSMGHGSAPTQVERMLDSEGNLAAGRYRVRNVHFIMGGEWEVRIELTSPQGGRETQSFLVRLSGGHGGHRGNSLQN